MLVSEMEQIADDLEKFALSLSSAEEGFPVWNFGGMQHPAKKLQLKPRSKYAKK